MFIMLLHCPLDKTSTQQELKYHAGKVLYFPQALQDYKPVGLHWINFYEILFKKFSSQSIFKWLFYLNKVSFRKENEILTVGSFGEKAAIKLHGSLLQIFAKKINLQYRNIEAALTSKKDLQDFYRKLPFASLKNETEMCIYQEDCLQSIGEIQRV